MTYGGLNFWPAHSAASLSLGRVISNNSRMKYLSFPLTEIAKTENRRGRSWVPGKDGKENNSSSNGKDSFNLRVVSRCTRVLCLT